MLKLPSEIYLLIFSFVDRRQLLKLATVSKEWSLSALIVYYEEVNLIRYNTRYLKALLDQDSCFRYSHWTETLFIHFKKYRASDSEDEDEEQDESTKQEFLKFLSYFPNTKRIEFIGSGVDLECVEYLLAVDTRQHLTRLESFDIAFYRDNNIKHRYFLHYSLYYHFRSSLAQMSLRHDNSSILSVPYGGILNYISQFKKLTHLLYNNDTRQPVTLYDIQIACPTLTNIEFCDKVTTPSFLSGSGILFCKDSNLKKLSITYANITKDYTEGIIKHLPKSLESLEIKMEGIDMFDWIHQVGIDNVLKLVKHMNTLSSAFLHFNPGILYSGRYNNPNELYITTFFKILHVFKGDKKLRCTATCCDRYLFKSSMGFTGKDLIIHYGINVAGSFYGYGFQPEIPDTMISTIGLEVIHSMSFNVSVFEKELPFKILNHFLTYCPHLQLLSFEDSSAPYRYFALSSSKTHLGFKKNYDLLTTSKENLKFARLSNIVPFQAFVDLLAVRLPYIHIPPFSSTDASNYFDDY